jgi:hypothetical protein
MLVNRREAEEDQSSQVKASSVFTLAGNKGIPKATKVVVEVNFSSQWFLPMTQ